MRRLFGSSPSPIVAADYPDFLVLDKHVNLKITAAVEGS
jgi:hypothetical protein